MCHCSLDLDCHCNLDLDCQNLTQVAPKKWALDYALKALDSVQNQVALGLLEAANLDSKHCMQRLL